MKMAATENPRETVLAFVKALNEEDFDRARTYVNDDLSFEGVLGSRQGAEAYFQDMTRMRLKYDVKKVFSDSTDVCIFNDVTMSGAKILVASWYHVDQGKIRSLRVVFDPRPLLATKAA
ncbi:conserved hypothetical protein [Candidatus Sulfotelmatomonas gaucii]|uniref:SnoaL-like domain-containing protein n=1 Tax=Candidatus Sulfuritelmatomonas gaucii TaxID=2043161 RepID=A0A2N9M417_9BACT|nr:conserved hypothetical protein [Candidatus Sulfotelmatomonas gaucii]